MISCCQSKYKSVGVRARSPRGPGRELMKAVGREQQRTHNCPYTKRPPTQTLFPPSTTSPTRTIDYWLLTIWSLPSLLIETVRGRKQKQGLTALSQFVIRHCKRKRLPAFFSRYKLRHASQSCGLLSGPFQFQFQFF